MSRTGDGGVEEATAVELPSGEVVVSVDGVELPQRYGSLEDAIRAESVLHLVDDRKTVFWSPILPSWELVELLQRRLRLRQHQPGDLVVGGRRRFGWRFENPERRPEL